MTGSKRARDRERESIVHSSEGGDTTFRSRLKPRNGGPSPSIAATRLTRTHMCVGVCVCVCVQTVCVLVSADAGVGPFPSIAATRVTYTHMCVGVCVCVCV